MTFHHERRIARALHHLESLKAETRSWGEERPYRVWSDFDVNVFYKLTWLEVVEQPPADLNLIVGDCVHNLRAALDNLALELALVNNGGRVARSMEGDSGFPTLKQQNSSEFKRMLREIDKRAKKIIEELQPCKKRDGFRNDYLWQLNWFDIQDKHRLPDVVLFAQAGSSLFVPDNLRTNDIQYFWHPVERRASIARYPAFDKTGAEVNAQERANYTQTQHRLRTKGSTGLQNRASTALVGVCPPLHHANRDRPVAPFSYAPSVTPSEYCRRGDKSPNT